MKSPNNTFVRPGARRQTIPPGTILKSRLDRRKEEKKKSWKKKLPIPNLLIMNRIEIKMLSFLLPAKITVLF